MKKGGEEKGRGGEEREERKWRGVEWESGSLRTEQRRFLVV